MMTCDHCNGPGEGSKCCWERAMDIKRFKKHVLRKFVFEVMFDMIVSLLSVITDIATVVLYIWNRKWPFVFLTAIPVILPTTVFTNIYLSDESRGYCKMPSDRLKKRQPRKTCQIGGMKLACPTVHSVTQNCTSCFNDLTCGIRCTSARQCCGGMFHMLFDKDPDSRKNGAGIVRKSIRRSAKYFFGTFILRFIAWAWYFKALIYGYKAYRQPKKYMKIVSPDQHWSHELLVRLDFLQAALENAPQCVVQIFALVTQSDEQVFLGLLTLSFSFLDFVRVATAILWDLHKGPVIAPPGCYGTIGWKLINYSSWIFLYAARSCSLALVVATSNEGWSMTITIVCIVFHIVLFSRLFTRNKYGVATEKVAVSTFISIFFLPELNSSDVERLVQFYYAMVLLQNFIFIIPWNGLDWDYCIQKPPIVTAIGNSSTNSSLFVLQPDEFTSPYLGTPVFGPPQFSPYNTFENDFEVGNFDKRNNCLIDPVVIVLLVPAATILGVVLRMAAAQKMQKFQETVPEKMDSMKMEERVAQIYRKKWTKMSMKELSVALLRMLKKEVLQTDPDKAKRKSVAMISNPLQEEFRASQTFIRKSFSMIFMNRSIIPGDQQRDTSQDIDSDNNSKLAITREYGTDKDKNWSFPTRSIKSRSQSQITYGDSPYKASAYFTTGDEISCSSSANVEKDNEDRDSGLQSQADEETSQISVIPQSFFAPVLQRNRSNSISSDGDNLLRNFGLDIHAVQIDAPDRSDRTYEIGWI